MICPKCRYRYTRVLVGKVTGKEVHERTRECCNCAYAFKTVEILKPETTRRGKRSQAPVPVPAADNTTGAVPTAESMRKAGMIPPGTETQAAQTTTPAPPAEDWRSNLERELRGGN